MMNQTFNTVVAEAKAKAANSPAWVRCLDKAATMLASGELVATVLADGVLVTSPNGSYKVTAGHCPCAARTAHCYHRCAARIATLLDAAELAEVAADIATSPRQHLIIEIENIWNRVETTPLAVALMARFGVNRLDMLNDSWLRDIRLAIAA